MVRNLQRSVSLDEGASLDGPEQGTISSPQSPLQRVLDRTKSMAGENEKLDAAKIEQLKARASTGVLKSVRAMKHVSAADKGTERDPDYWAKAKSKFTKRTRSEQAAVKQRLLARQAEAFLTHLSFATAVHSKKEGNKSLEDLAPEWVTAQEKPPEDGFIQPERPPPPPEIDPSELKAVNESRRKKSHKAGDMLWQVHRMRYLGRGFMEWAAVVGEAVHTKKEVDKSEQQAAELRLEMARSAAETRYEMKRKNLRYNAWEEWCEHLKNEKSNRQWQELDKRKREAKKRLAYRAAEGKFRYHATREWQFAWGIWDAYVKAEKFKAAEAERLRREAEREKRRVAEEARRQKEAARLKAESDAREARLEQERITREQRNAAKRAEEKARQEEQQRKQLEEEALRRAAAAAEAERYRRETEEMEKRAAEAGKKFLAIMMARSLNAAYMQWRGVIRAWGSQFKILHKAATNIKLSKVFRMYCRLREFTEAALAELVADEGREVHMSVYRQKQAAKKWKQVRRHKRDAKNRVTRADLHRIKRKYGKCARKWVQIHKEHLTRVAAVLKHVKFLSHKTERFALRMWRQYTKKIKAQGFMVKHVIRCLGSVRQRPSCSIHELPDISRPH